MSETAFDKLANLKTLQEIQDLESRLSVSVDEYGFYYIGDMIFNSFKAALKYLNK
jgi:hypothetical protein